jgi:hypothetical protein
VQVVDVGAANPYKQEVAGSSPALPTIAQNGLFAPRSTTLFEAPLQRTRRMRLSFCHWRAERFGTRLYWSEFAVTTCGSARTDHPAKREDILDFMTYCYKLGPGKRTVYDKLVVQLFKRHGRTNLVRSGDWPDYVDAIRPIYDAEELEAMLKVATEREATLIMLNGGM